MVELGNNPNPPDYPTQEIGDEKLQEALETLWLAGTTQAELRDMIDNALVRLT